MNAEIREIIELVEESLADDDGSMIEYCIIEKARSDGRDMAIIFIGELDDCEAHISERDETLPFCEGRYRVDLF